MSSSDPTMSVWSRLWRWLVYGRSGSSSGTFLYTPVPQGWWHVPGRVYRVLKNQRSIQPTPLTYLMIAALGIIVGVILQLTVGLWWWTVPIMFLIIGWLTFFLSWWWRSYPGQDRSQFRIELLMAVNPAKGGLAYKEHRRKLLLSSELPLFEIPTWSGAMSLGQWGTSNGKVTSMTVSFADAKEQPPIASVGTIEHVQSNEYQPLSTVQQEVISLSMSESYRTDIHSTEELLDAHQRHREEYLVFDEEVTRLPWEPTSLTIEGVDYPAKSISVNGITGAYCEYENFWVWIVTPEGEKFSFRKIVDPSALFNDA